MHCNYSISILHMLQMLVRQHGGTCEHFNGWLHVKDASAWSQDGTLRAYTLSGDPARKVWFNGEHVASVIRW